MIGLSTIPRDPWSVFDELVSLQRGFNELLDGREPNAGRLSYPPMNVWAGSEDLVVDAELPGADPKAVEISVVGDQLTVAGEVGVPTDKDDTSKVWHRKECARGRFSRTLQLPFTAEADKVKAVYRNGILRITVPKAESEKPRKIAIEA